MSELARLEGLKTKFENIGINGSEEGKVLV